MTDDVNGYLDRVRAEKAALDDGLGKLVVFVHSSEFTGLPAEERDLLLKQRNIMYEYASVLEQRIARFTSQGG